MKGKDPNSDPVPDPSLRFIFVHLDTAPSWILREVYPEGSEGLRMTIQGVRFVL